VNATIGIIVSGVTTVLFHLKIMNRNKIQNMTTIGVSSLSKEGFVFVMGSMNVTIS
jgi:hypothetical protein